MTPSVIIPYRDRPESLARTLATIRVYWRGEILVIDDDSESSVASEICSKWFAAYYRLPDGEPGPFRPSTTRNAGAALSSGDILVFNDVDVTHESRALEGILRQAELLPFPAIIVPDVHYLEEGKLRPSRRRIFQKLAENDWELSGEWLSAWSTLLAVPRSIFNAVGGFDENYLGWSLEDMDFAYRAAKVGYRFAYTRKALGVHWPHPVQPGRAETSKMAYRYWHSKHGFPIPCELIDSQGQAVELRTWRRP
jgi:predicted glycosyltransferase involved in capsule biosynthesis